MELILSAHSDDIEFGIIALFVKDFKVNKKEVAIVHRIADPRISLKHASIRKFIVVRINNGLRLFVV